MLGANTVALAGARSARRHPAVGIKTAAAPVPSPSDRRISSRTILLCGAFRSSYVLLSSGRGHARPGEQGVRRGQGRRRRLARDRRRRVPGPGRARRAAASRRCSGCSRASRTSTGGTIVIGDRDVTDLAPRSRDIAMVFQSYALYPHMTVRQNLGYGLRARRTPKDEIARRVDEVAELLGLADLLERRPAQLSGGQRQRVAMGRAIVRAAAGVPARRAALQPRREAARRHARLARAAAPAPRRHDRLRHARPDRGDDARAAGRGDARRPHPPVRPPVGALRAAERPLHRGVHRLAGDEPRRGVPRRRHDPVRAVHAAGSARPGPRARRPRHPAGGLRARRTPRCRRSTSRIEVVEDLGSETHVFFHVDAPADHRRGAGIGFRQRDSWPPTGRCSPRGSMPARRSGRRDRGARRRRRALPLLRPRHRRAARPATPQPALAGAQS